jgi:hypothetical protein
VNLLAPLGITIIVELFIAILLGYRCKYQLLVIVAINLITNPPLNLLLDTYNIDAVWLIALEILIVIVEWRALVWTLGNSNKRMLFLSTIMNLSSFAGGYLVFALIRGF